VSLSFVILIGSYVVQQYDVTQETWRNVRSYMILVGVACLVGIPLAIAFGTVLWQTLKAAKTNPAEALKNK
jgi:ABC-type lipoprotein release transport system permease subunit